MATTNKSQLEILQQAQETTTGHLLVDAGTPTAVTVKQAAVTVGVTAVRCTNDGAAPATTRTLLVIQPDPASTAKFYVGSSTVTSTSTTRGIQLIGGQILTLTNDAGNYYIISDTSSQTVFILEQE